MKLLGYNKISSCFWGRKGYLKQGTKRTNYKGKDKINWTKLKLRTSVFQKTQLRVKRQATE